MCNDNYHPFLPSISCRQFEKEQRLLRAAQEVQECPNCLEKGHSEEQCPLFDGQDTWCERCGRNHFGNCATFSLQQNGTRGR